MQDIDHTAEEMEYKLTRKSFDEWFDALTEEEWQDLSYSNLGKSSRYIYLKEHGLPLDSEVK